MAVFYNRKGGKLNVIRHGHKPRNMSIYRRPVSYRDKVINYLCLEDGISGAAKMARKDVLIYYMKFLLNRVIYIEDYFIRLAVLDDRKIMHFPSTVIWYEFGDGGISTTGERKWREPKRKDNLMAYEICLECLDGGITPNAEIRSWLLESIEFRKIISLTFLDKFTHYLKHPYWLVLKIYYKFFGEYSPTNIDDTFFNRCFRNT